MRLRRHLHNPLQLAAWLLALGIITGAAGTAQATWQLYGSGEFGYSIGSGQTSGTSTITSAELSGSDSDVSPLLSGAVGVQMPMEELTPWRLPSNWRVPDWPLRLEIEFAGLREYELETPGQNPGTPLDLPFHSTVKSWSMLNNLWIDLPLTGLYRPVASTTRLISGRQRLTGFRRFLRSSSLYVGVGIGFSQLSLETSDSVIGGETSDINFAYQVGTGFGYQLTDRVNLGAGYRYFRPGTSELTLEGTSGLDRGDFALESQAHEVNFSLRILLYDLPDPWR